MSDQPPLDEPSSDPKPKPNNRRTILIIAALGLIFSCAACTLISFILPDTRSPATRSEQADVLDEATAVPEASLETGRNEPPEPTLEPIPTDEPEPTPLPDPTDTPEPTPLPEPTDTPEPDFDPTIYITGSNISLDDIPQGEPGLVVVLAGPPGNFGVVPIVIRNNTDEPVFDIELSATARDAAGNILGTARGDDIVPDSVPPGGLAIGRVLFRDTPLENATLDYVLSGGDAPGFLFVNRDLEIVEHNLVGGNVVGLALNNHDSALNLIEVVVMCFDDQSVPTTVRSDFTDQDRVEAGAELPFSVDLLGDEAKCNRYLLAGNGWETE